MFLNDNSLKYVHTYRTDRHKRQADITLLFQYISLWNNANNFERLNSILIFFLKNDLNLHDKSYGNSSHL